MGIPGKWSGSDFFSNCIFFMNYGYLIIIINIRKLISHQPTRLSPLESLLSTMYLVAQSEKIKGTVDHKIQHFYYTI